MYGYSLFSNFAWPDLWYMWRVLDSDEITAYDIVYDTI